MNRIDKALSDIKEEVLSCKKCPLYKKRKLPVIGQGDHKARIMFIGEAPGKNEDLTGFPFCGRSGQVLDSLLNVVNMKREAVYIANVIKCRPPLNRDPEDREIKACSGYIERQIEIINPKVIVSLGRYSMRFVMERFGLGRDIDVISKIHGRVFEAGSKKIVAFYHPAVSVYNPNMFEALKKDFEVLKRYAD
jgi:uracil-DNA glycosylase